MNKTFINKKFFRQTDEVDETIIQDIKKRFPSPIIGVIGASNPDFYYCSQMGIVAGFLLAKRCHEKGGSIFTGGVDGVGSDVFTGVAMYCAKNKVKVPFFVMIPNGYEHVEYSADQDIESDEQLDSELKATIEILPFNLSSAYTSIEQIAEVEIEKVRTGKEMSERRLYVAKGCDILVMINGGIGTLDEAKVAVANGKKVIVVNASAGAAGAVARWINKIQPTFNDGQFKNMLRQPPTIQQKERFLIVNQFQDIITTLDKIFTK